MMPEPASLSDRSNWSAWAKGVGGIFALAYLELGVVVLAYALLEGGSIGTAVAAGALLPLVSGFGFALWAGLTFIPNLVVVSYVRDRWFGAALDGETECD